MRAGEARAVLVLGGCAQLLDLEPGATDTDGDGVADTGDNCEAVANPDQADGDGDGTGDACSVVTCTEPLWGRDLDRDGVDDACDACVTGPGPVGDDTDADGLPAECDPCPTGGGVDADGDHVEDACQAGVGHDEDGDAVLDPDDNCPTVVNPDQANLNADGAGDACEPAPGRFSQVLFEPFFDPTLPGWQVLPAAWSIDADAVVARGVTADASVAFLGTLTTFEGWFEAVVTIEAGVGHEQDSAVFGLGSAGGAGRVGCRLSGAGLLSLEFEVVAGPSPKGDQAQTPFLAGETVRLRLVRRTIPMTAMEVFFCQAEADGMVFSTAPLDQATLGRIDRPFVGARGSAPTSVVRFASLWGLVPQ
ncbi:MAG: thrombospondin type 3 repeat-containing protein [Kofleriaceae bacterium]|nr:thrombospondin type 3 repeat-containing protein [Kofleriaceae bacterium]